MPELASLPVRGIRPRRVAPPPSIPPDYYHEDYYHHEEDNVYDNGDDGRREWAFTSSGGSLPPIARELLSPSLRSEKTTTFKLKPFHLLNASCSLFTTPSWEIDHSQQNLESQALRSPRHWDCKMIVKLTNKVGWLWTNVGLRRHMGRCWGQWVEFVVGAMQLAAGVGGSPPTGFGFQRCSHSLDRFPSHVTISLSSHWLQLEAVCDYTE